MADNKFRSYLQRWQLEGWSDVLADIASNEAAANQNEFARNSLSGGKVLTIVKSPGATLSADFTTASDIWVELDQNCTITVNVLPIQAGPNAVSNNRLYVNTKGFSVTWAGVDVWSGGAPTMSTNTTTIIEFISPDAGTTVVGRALSDSITELTIPPTIRTGYNFTSFGIFLIDLVLENTLVESTYLRFGCEYSKGGVSSQIVKGYISCAYSKDEYFEEIDLFTRTTSATSLWLARYWDGGKFHGGVNAAYNGPASPYVWAYFAAGHPNSDPKSTTSWFDKFPKLNMSTVTYSSNYLTSGETIWALCAAISTTTKGRMHAGRKADVYQTTAEIIDFALETTTNIYPGNTATANVWNNQANLGYLAGQVRSSYYDGLARIDMDTDTYTSLGTFPSFVQRKGSGGGQWSQSAGASNEVLGMVLGESTHKMPMATETPVAIATDNASDSVLASFNDFGRT